MRFFQLKIEEKNSIKPRSFNFAGVISSFIGFKLLKVGNCKWSLNVKPWLFSE